MQNDQLVEVEKLNEQMRAFASANKKRKAEESGADPFVAGDQIASPEVKPIEGRRLTEGQQQAQGAASRM